MPNTQVGKVKYDLEERTTKFAKSIIELAKKIQESSVTRPLIAQLIRSATSIGANYCEANNAESRKDFRHKISICRKEAKETKYWLNIMIEIVPLMKVEIQILTCEANELTLIFNAIVNTINQNF